MLTKDTVGKANGVAANNSDNINPILGHMNMWNARKLLIQAYDTDDMRSNNVYIVDLIFYLLI